MDESSRDRLWQNYSKTHSSEYRDQLILEYAQLVKLVAGRLSMYLGYNVEYDDLVVASISLSESGGSFSPFHECMASNVSSREYPD